MRTFQQNGTAQCATLGCPGDPGLMPHCPACQWHGLVGVLVAESDDERQRQAAYQVDYIRREVSQRLRAARKRRAVYGLIYVAALLGFMVLCWSSWPR